MNNFKLCEDVVMGFGFGVLDAHLRRAGTYEAVKQFKTQLEVDKLVAWIIAQDVFRRYLDGFNDDDRHNYEHRHIHAAKLVIAGKNVITEFSHKNILIGSRVGNQIYSGCEIDDEMYDLSLEMHSLGCEDVKKFGGKFIYEDFLLEKYKINDIEYNHSSRLKRFEGLNDYLGGKLYKSIIPSFSYSSNSAASCLVGDVWDGLKGSDNDTLILNQRTIIKDLAIKLLNDIKRYHKRK